MALKQDVQLRPHQKAALKKLEQQGGSALFSHPVGSGKTITGVAAFEKLRSQGKASKALVVTPASLRTNFAEGGVKQFTDDDYVIFGNKQEANDPNQPKAVDADTTTPDQTPGYGIVSYDIFRKDPEKYLKAHGADTVILDEIHKARNDASQTFQALRKHRDKFKNFIGMTGSIANNSPSDIVPLIDAMTGGKHRLGSKSSFEDRFVRTNKKGQKELHNPHLVKFLTAPYVHHVEKSEIERSDNKPPKKIVKQVEVPMSSEQSQMYRYVMDTLDPLTKAKMKLNVGKLSDKELKGVYGKLLKTRQLSNSVAALDRNKSLSQAAVDTPKVRRMLDDIEKHIKTTPDAQVVVHSNLLQGGLDVAQQGLKDRGIDYGTFIGKGNKGVTEASRQQAVNDFNAGRKKVLVISSAGGEGLDLPNTTMFASMDGHFNPEKINQAEARGIRAGGLAHRPEEDRRVKVNRYVSTLPRSKSHMGVQTLRGLSPQTYIDRMIQGEKVFQNPYKAERSADQFIYEAAASKDNANSQLRSLLDKTAARGDKKSKYAKPGYHPNQKLMQSYHKEFGDDLLTGKYDDAEFINPEKELEHIHKLRDYYKAMAQPGDKVFRVPKEDRSDYEGVNSRAGIAWQHLKSNLPMGLASGATLGTMIPASVLLKEIKTAHPGTRMATAKKFVKPLAIVGTVPGAGAVGLSVGLNAFLESKKPHTDVSLAQSRRRAKMSDENLLRLLRGQVVSSEKVTKKEEYV